MLASVTLEGVAASARPPFTMPVYHSSFNDMEAREACGCSILPLATSKRGPAPPPAPAAAAGGGAFDIVDEAIRFFRANVFFKNFEIKGPADRVLVYLTLFTHYCIHKVATLSAADGRRELARIAIAKPSIPGEPGFPVSSMFHDAANAEEAELCRTYLKQCRETLVERLQEKIYTGDVPNKFWLAFAKRKFMNKVLTA